MGVGLQNMNAAGAVLFDSEVDTTLFHYEEQIRTLTAATLDYSAVGARFPVPFILLSNNSMTINYSSWGYTTMNVNWVSPSQIELLIQGATNTKVVSVVAAPSIASNIFVL